MVKLHKMICKFFSLFAVIVIFICHQTNLAKASDINNETLKSLNEFYKSNQNLLKVVSDLIKKYDELIKIRKKTERIIQTPTTNESNNNNINNNLNNNNNINNDNNSSSESKLKPEDSITAKTENIIENDSKKGKKVFVVKTVTNNSKKQQTNPNNGFLMLLVKNVSDKFEWTADEIEKYFVKTWAEVTTSLTNIDLLVEDVLLSPNNLHTVLKLQKMTKDLHNNHFSQKLCKDLFLLHKLVKKWSWTLDEIEDFFNFLNHSFSDFPKIYYHLEKSNNSHITEEELKDLISDAKKFPGDFDTNFMDMLKLNEIFPDRCRKILNKFLNMQPKLYSSKLLQNITVYYKKYSEISDKMLSDLIETGTVIKTHVLTYLYFLAAQKNIVPETFISLLKCDKINEISLQNLEYLIVLLNYMRVNKYDINPIIYDEVDAIRYIYINCENKWKTDDISQYIYSTIGQNQRTADVVMYLTISEFNKDTAIEIRKHDKLHFWVALKRAKIDFNYVFHLKSFGRSVFKLFRSYVYLIRSGLCNRSLKMYELESAIKYGISKARKTIFSEKGYNILLKFMCQNTELLPYQMEAILTCSEHVRSNLKIIEILIQYSTSQSWYFNTAKRDNKYHKCMDIGKIMNILKYINSKSKLEDDKKDLLYQQIFHISQDSINAIFDYCSFLKWTVKKSAAYMAESLIHEISLPEAYRFLKVDPSLSPEEVAQIKKIKSISYWELQQNHGFSDLTAVLALKDNQNLLAALNGFIDSECKTLSGKKLISIMNCDKHKVQFDKDYFVSLFNKTCLFLTDKDINSICNTTDKALEQVSNYSNRKFGPTHWDEKFVIELLNHSKRAFRTSDEWESTINNLDNQTMRVLVFSTTHNVKKDVFNYIYNSYSKNILEKPMLSFVKLTEYQDCQNAELLQTTGSYSQWSDLKNLGCDVENIAKIIKENYTRVWELIDIMRKLGKTYTACSKNDIFKKILQYDKLKNYSHEEEDFKIYLEHTNNINPKTLSDLFKIAIDNEIEKNNFVSFFKNGGIKFYEDLIESKQFLNYFRSSKTSALKAFNFLLKAVNTPVDENVLKQFFNLNHPMFIKIIEDINNIDNFFNLIKDVKTYNIYKIFQVAKEGNRSAKEIINFFFQNEGSRLLKVLNSNNEFNTYLKSLTDNGFTAINELSTLLSRDKKFNDEFLKIFFDNGGSKHMDTLLCSSCWDLEKLLNFIKTKLMEDKGLVKLLFNCSQTEFNKMKEFSERWRESEFEEYVLQSLKNNVTVNDMTAYAELATNHQSALALQKMGPIKLWKNLINKSDLTFDEIIQMYQSNENILPILINYDEKCDKIERDIVLDLTTYDNNNDKKCTGDYKTELQQFFTILCRPENFPRDLRYDTKEFFSKTLFPDKSCIELQGVINYRVALKETKDLEKYIKKWLEIFNDNKWDTKSIMNIFKSASEQKFTPSLINDAFTYFTSDVINYITSDDTNQNWTLTDIMNVLLDRKIEDKKCFINLLKKLKFFTQRTVDELLTFQKDSKFTDDNLLEIVNRYHTLSKELSEDDLIKIIKLKNNWTINTLLKCIDNSKENWWKTIQAKNFIHPCEIIFSIGNQKNLIPLDVITLYSKESKCENIDAEALKLLIKCLVQSGVDESQELEISFKKLCDINVWSKEIFLKVIKKGIEILSENNSDLMPETIPFILTNFTKREVELYDNLIDITSSTIGSNFKDLYVEKSTNINEITKEFILNYAECKFKPNDIEELIENMRRNKVKSNAIVDAIKKTVKEKKSGSCQWETFLESIGKFPTKISTD
ncbi:uncharacterized protein LOC142326214 [Lycorma delicatula]|uniref:uncharacterized protein LOC142326214 n=1 Tax=Lycorma delicatula TaxID=130591 RepID=UPI003F510520